MAICQALRIPAAPIGNGANLPGLSQFAERGFYAELPGTDVVAPVAPYRLSATPARPGPPPVPGRAASPHHRSVVPTTPVRSSCRSPG